MQQLVAWLFAPCTMGGGARVCEIPFGGCHAVPLKCKAGAARKDFTSSVRGRGGGRSGG